MKNWVPCCKNAYIIEVYCKVDKDLSPKWLLHKGATPWPSRGTIDNHVRGREMNRSGQPPWQVLKGCQTKRAGEKDWQMTL